VSVRVAVLDLPPLEPYLLHLLPGAEGLLEHRTREHVLQLGPDERSALARLHVLEVGDGEERTVQRDRHSVTEIGGTRHKFSWISDLRSCGLRPPRLRPLQEPDQPTQPQKIAV